MLFERSEREFLFFNRLGFARLCRHKPLITKRFPVSIIHLLYMVLVLLSYGVKGSADYFTLHDLTRLSSCG